MIYRGTHGCTNDSSAEPVSNAGGLEFFDVNSSALILLKHPGAPSLITLFAVR